MKSTQVYAVLRDCLAPTLKEAGFKRTKSMLSWARLQHGRHLVMWCQVSQHGWDAYSGSQFVFECQLSDEPVVGKGILRERLAALLDDGGREEIRVIQNAIITSLRRPPSNHPFLTISPQFRELYLQSFEPITAPYPRGQDVWLRYHDQDHVSIWGDFIKQKLPECFRKMEAFN